MRKKTCGPFYLQSTMICLLLALISSCINDAGRAGRAPIEQFSFGNRAVEGCGTLFFNSLEDACVEECPAGSELALDEILDQVREEANDNLLQIIDDSAGICIEEQIKISRPTNQIFVKPDYCSCIDGKPDILNNCDNFCASQTEQVATLFGSVTLGSDVFFNESLGNLANWCRAIIDDGFTGANCKLEAFDGLSTRKLDVNVPDGSNTFNAVISGLEFNKTYVMRLVEQTSGARSDPFQVIRKRQSTTAPGPTGPLKIMSVSQYTCVRRSGTIIDNDTFFENAIRQHFYFASNEAPPSLPPGDPLTVCHDPITGINDSPLKPRLELIPQNFAVWDLSDFRFIDVSPQDGAPDINTQIAAQLASEYGISDAEVNLFGLLRWPNSPVATQPVNVGIFMQAFVNPVTGRAFCPGQDEYFSDDPVFQILREKVGVSTEGLYLAEKEPEALFDDEGRVIEVPTDTIIIRENLLKKIWFYFENGQHFIPDEVTANTRTIRFYYPPDIEDPYTKKSTQRIYTVRAPSQLGQAGNIGLPTSVPIPDKRFGCVPALD